MPIPGSVLNSKFPFGVGAAVSFYPSLATLRPMTEMTDTTGQLLRTFADSEDEAYIDMNCRLSPLILIRPQQQEYDRPGVQQLDAKFQVNLNVYIDLPTETLDLWQIKVDDKIYQIRSTEFDGNRLTTRFMVSDAIPFAEPMYEASPSDEITMDDVTNMDNVTDMDTLEETIV